MHRLMMSKPKENLIVDHGYVYAFEHRARG
jgi:hypothetical protein